MLDAIDSNLDPKLDSKVALALTGMQIGGVTPFGLPDHISIYIDGAVLDVDVAILGGGNRESKVLLAPSELRKLPNVQFVEGLGILKQAP